MAETELIDQVDLAHRTGVSYDALEKYQKAGYISPVSEVDDIPKYTLESVAIVRAMNLCMRHRRVDLTEAYEMARRGMSEKKRRSEELARIKEGQDDHHGVVDPNKIVKHPRFETLLRIVEKVLESITMDMGVNGYDPLQPVLMATWDGLKKSVLIDGHTRVQAAIEAGVSEIPYVIREFDDELAALLHTTKLQKDRRLTSSGDKFRLFESIDALAKRGGDRRSKRAKSKPPDGGIEKKPSLSARWTAAAVGWTVRMVERARRVRDQGTPEILEAVRNDEMTIGNAEKAIAERKYGAKSPVKKNDAAMVQLNDENLAALKELSGNLHEHVNAAIKQYISNRGWEKPVEQEETEPDDQKPRLIQ
jgi:hypothetical protein